MQQDLARSIFVLEEDIEQKKVVLANYKDQVGKFECLQIVYSHFPIAKVEAKVKQYSEKLVSIPLISVKTEDQTYDIYLRRIDKLVTGEYMLIEDLLEKVDNESRYMLISNLTYMEDLLSVNSQRVFAEISTSFKNSPKGLKFKGLIPSVKRHYLYYYPGDRKKTLGFVVG
jgi:hypothetical protein